jgi:inositol-hexakisphosphate/diphosphoinositol-pentakisphosphate 1-kinase
MCDAVATCGLPCLLCDRLVFNDLDQQELLFDRRRVYSILESTGVPVPKYVIFDADHSATTSIVEEDDCVTISGVKLRKPLVEKPVSGEDHNICIYYPRSQGGGSKRLFRKVGDCSAQYYPNENRLRLHDGGSYIYEELLQTEGTDVKVYAVGTEYAHAEARKSPIVDGRVLRNARGKEMRYPVILSAEEKEVARKVVLGFGQTMCGFDILRSNGKSFVCDVNGWASVKDSTKFWDDASNLLRAYCLSALAPSHFSSSPRVHPPRQPESPRSSNAVDAEPELQAELAEGIHGPHHSTPRPLRHQRQLWACNVLTPVLCL